MNKKDRINEETEYKKPKSEPVPNMPDAGYPAKVSDKRSLTQRGHGAATRGFKSSGPMF